MRGHTGTGSKSERVAILIQTDEGRFVLRRKGAKAFSDPELDRFVGETVRVNGFLVAGATLLATQIDVVD
jgi:hypothetical protein